MIGVQEDISPKIDEEGHMKIQQIVGSILYYVHMANTTLLMALGSITRKQTHATKSTEMAINYFINVKLTLLPLSTALSLT